MTYRTATATPAVPPPAIMKSKVVLAKVAASSDAADAVTASARNFKNQGSDMGRQNDLVCWNLQTFIRSITQPHEGTSAIEIILGYAEHKDFDESSCKDNDQKTVHPRAEPRAIRASRSFKL